MILYLFIVIKGISKMYEILYVVSEMQLKPNYIRLQLLGFL